MNRFISKLKSQRGQSSVEFLLVSMVLISFIFFHITMSLVFMSSSYLDYAIFMAGRAATSSVYSVENGPDGETTKELFLATLSTYIRSDSEADTNLLANEDTFFNPLVILDRDDTRETIVDNGFPRDPETGFTTNGSRSYQVKFSFKHMFFLVGSTFLPSGNNFSYVDNSGISHFFRREVSVEECQSYFDNFVSANPTWSQENLNSSGVFGVFYDNGC